MKYTIDGVTYGDPREVTDTYGCSDYNADDWDDIYNMSYDEIRQHNAIVFSHLDDQSQDALANATWDYATHRSRINTRENTQ